MDHNKLWKALKGMVIADHLICLLKNLHASQDATELCNGTTDWLRIEEGVGKGCLLSPVPLTYTQGTSYKMLGWRSYELV